MHTNRNDVGFAVVVSVILLCATPVMAEPGISVDPLSLSFFNVTPGCSTSQTVTITSMGSDLLTVSNAQFTMNDFDAYSFAPPSFPINLNPGESIDLIISFSPPFDTMMLADLQIESNAGNVMVSIIGDGYGTDPCGVPDIDVSPAVYDFGTRDPGDPKSAVITIANNGSDMLNVLGMDFDGDTTAFTLNPNGGSDPCGSAYPYIGPGAECTVEVTFEATDAGNYLGRLYIESNDPHNPLVAIVLTGSILTRQPISLSLHIEDALEGIPVNKVVGDVNGPATHTRVDIAVKLISLSAETAEDISVVLAIPGDLFGPPIFTSVRVTTGGPETLATYEEVGKGRYRVTTDLARFSLHPPSYRKQIVWSFEIPNGTLPQFVEVTAEVEVPSSDPVRRGTIRILSPGSVESLIVANRKLLYEKYDSREVTSLLQRLYTEAQGRPASASPRGAIYYVERYSASAYFWDNSSVDYTSESTANETAADIDALIEDWTEDASLIVPIEDLPGWTRPIALPTHLLIVGNDDTIPFYRYNDPTNYLPEETWGVDSSTNPAIRATDENFLFTDNPYADYWGTDWERGNIEFSVGRLLGDSAADMLSLLEEGVNGDNGRTGGVVMASLEGLELGLEPDDGRTGEIADLHDVPELFRNRGFEVRNDGIPSTEQRTIDLIMPYEPGLFSAFRNAANDPRGMDLFFIGTHSDYSQVLLPSESFTPDDTCAEDRCLYHRFDDDHPISVIFGCHGGVPVRDIDVNGGKDHSLVYDLIHEGSRAFIGPTGYAYGSVDGWVSRFLYPETGNIALHQSIFGENLMQRFFGNLLEPDDSFESVSMTIGEALAQAKKDYVFGIHPIFPEEVPTDWDAVDRKTVTQFLLYGVPWTTISYPGAPAAALEPKLQKIMPSQKRAYVTDVHPVMGIAEGIYAQTFEVSIDSYEVRTVTYDTTDYDHFLVEGADTAIVPGAPILPYIKSHTVSLPFGAVVSEINVIEIESENIGTHSVPVAEVYPLSEGGISYTLISGISYLYPENAHLVQYQQTSEGLLFTLYPFQHNPATGQTTFNSHFEVQIIYESPLVAAVTGFKAEKRQYAPGESISTTARISNVGNVDIELTAILDAKNALGQAVGNESVTSFSVPSGDFHILSIELEGILENGDYTVQMSLLSGDEIVGGASAVVSVVGLEIEDLTVPDVLWIGEEGIYEVVFSNYASESFEGEVFLAIQDSQGGFVKELVAQLINVAPGASETAVFNWTPSEVIGGTYTALAKVVSGDQVYASMVESFLVISFEVPVDMKLGKCQNPVIRLSNGILTVAVLGTEDIDVSLIDRASIRLEGVPPIGSTIEDMSAPAVDRQHICDCSTPTYDGFDDLILKFRARDLVNAFGKVQDREPIILNLTGTLSGMSGDMIFGSRDCVWISMKEMQGRQEHPSSLPRR